MDTGKEGVVMKQLAQYHVRFDSKTIALSVAFMGVAIFLQAIFFFVIRDITQVATGDLVLFLILPAVLELGWIVLLHTVKLDMPRVYAILGCAICVLLAVQIYFVGSVVQMVLGTIAYLLGCGLLVLILWGYFPYKYFGLAWFVLVACVRYFGFDVSRYISCGDWKGFLLEASGLCVICAMALFFGGVSGCRNQT